MSPTCSAVTPQRHFPPRWCSKDETRRGLGCYVNGVLSARRGRWACSDAASWRRHITAPWRPWAGDDSGVWGHRRRVPAPAPRTSSGQAAGAYRHICPGTADTAPGLGVSTSQVSDSDNARNMTSCHSEPGNHLLSANTSTCCLHDSAKLSPGRRQVHRGVAEVYQGGSFRRELGPRPGIVRHGTALSLGPACHSMEWHGVQCRGMACSGMARHGMECVWHGEAWPRMCLAWPGQSPDVQD